MKKLTLKEAIAKGKLKQFIKEHENDPPGDKEKFDKLLEAATRKSSKAQKTSSQDASES